MRLRYLTSCLMIIGLTACASLPNQGTQETQAQLQQQATSALNKSLLQPNYQVDSSLKFNIQTKDIVSIYGENSKEYQRNKLLSDLEQRYTLVLDPSFKRDTTQPLDPKLKQLFQSLKIVGNGAALHANLTVDYPNKQFLMKFIADYNQANLSVQAQLPLLLDLKKKRLYINSFSKEELQKRGLTSATMYYVDLADYQDVFDSIDVKALLNFLQESNLASYLLLEGEHLETLALTDIERQQGAVRKIRLHTSIEQMLLKTRLFNLVNQTYIEKQMINGDKLKQLIEDTPSAPVSPSQGEQVDALLLEYFFQTQNNQSDDREELQAVKVEQQQQFNQQCKQVVDKGIELGLISFCYERLGEDILAKTPSNTITLEDQIHHLMYLEVNDDSPVTLAFRRYNTGKLVSANEFDRLLQTHQADLTALIQQVPTLSPLTVDLTIDQKGRVVHYDMQGQIKGKSTASQQYVDIQGTMNSRYYHYGTAKIDEIPVQQAKPMIDSIQSLKEKFNRTLPKHLGIDELDDMAVSLLEQGKSNREIYQVLFALSAMTYHDYLVKFVDVDHLTELAEYYYDSIYATTLGDTPLKSAEELDRIEEKYRLDYESDLSDTAELSAIILQSVIEDYAQKNEIPVMANDERLEGKRPEEAFAILYIDQLMEEAVTAKAYEELDTVATFLGKLYAKQRHQPLQLSDIDDEMTPELYEKWVDVDLYNEVIQQLNELGIE